MNTEQIKAELRLFKAYTDDTKLTGVGIVNQEALKSGLLIVDTCSEEVLTSAVELYGIKPEEWNQTFHKSFQTVLDTPIEVLVAQQLIHYFTTYGLEDLGMYNEDLVYIPREKLEVPELEEDIKLIPINKITELNLADRLQTLLTSGIALSKQTIADIMVLSDYLDKNKFDDIKNKEVKIALYEKYGVVPSNNMEFLRYLIYKLTGNTMMIRSREMIKALSECDKVQALDLLSAYVEKNGLAKLSEIYLQYDEYFVAIKSHNPERKADKSLNHLVNRLRKEAKHNKRCSKLNILDRLTSIYGITTDKTQLLYYNPWFKKSHDACGLTVQSIPLVNVMQQLDDVTIFREIRILNAIAYRLKYQDVISYKIRNGKAYITDLDSGMDNDKYNAQEFLYHKIKEHLVDRLRKYLTNKSVYIPENVVYMAPTSEKQFLGNFPLGTYIIVPRKNNMVVGIHWKNLDNERVDLDLHAYSRQSHIGWNSSYYNEGVVFSGDVTDAQLPKGATECFMIKAGTENTSFVIKLKNFTANKSDVPYEFIVASSTDTMVSKDYVINPNDVITSINTKIEYDAKSNTRPDVDVALVEVLTNCIKISFNNFSANTTIAHQDKTVLEKMITYGENYSNTQISLNNLLIESGCELLNKPYKEEMQEVKVKTENGEETLYRKVEKRADLDLSIEAISKDTFIKLFSEA